MTRESNVSNNEKAPEQTTPCQAPSASDGEGKPTISPAERWLRTREKAYVLAQKRGFVGGNPFWDWVEAEKEIDSTYVTDARAALDPAEITKQIKEVLSGHGLGELSVDALLDSHRERMERLAAFNRTLMDSTSELANQQTTLVQDSLNEAIHTLKDVAQGRLSTDGMAKQAGLSIKAIENAMLHLRALTEAVTGISTGSGKDRSSKP